MQEAVGLGDRSTPRANEADFAAARFPYRQALLLADPHHASDADQLATIPGGVPKPGAWPQGCHFHPRCRYATAACQERPIPLESSAAGREARCIHRDQLAALR
jgi:peptide/nickel transport system permease protein